MNALELSPEQATSASPKAVLPSLNFHSIQVSAVSKPAFRLDAAFYQSDFADALSRVRGCGFPIRHLSSFADAFVPGRIRLVTVPQSNAGAPYLKAHGAFEIRPPKKRFVARNRTKNYDELLLKKGMILTPSSGRNLGPVAYVGSYLSQFAMTDIMRLVPKSEADGFYLLAYLLTPTAQALIKRGRSGTTVDHLSPEEVLGIEVPWIDDEHLRNEIIADTKRAEDLLDEGRRGLDAAGKQLHELAGLSDQPPSAEYLSRSCGDAFSLSSSAVGLRLDAASHDPTALECAKIIKDRGGMPLGNAANLVTLERYIRFYVDPPNGRPVLSGRQMLQLRPVNLRRISDRSFKDPGKFVLKSGSTIFTCDGRSEEALGEPAYVMPAWDGWMASEHVMRVEPKGIGPGYLYIALASPWVQRQLKARATGSVIDALEPEEIENVMIPLVQPEQREALNAEVERCWGLVSESITLTANVTQRFERALVRRQTA